MNRKTRNRSNRTTKQPKQTETKGPRAVNVGKKQEERKKEQKKPNNKTNNKTWRERNIVFFCFEDGAASK